MSQPRKYLIITCKHCGTPNLCMGNTKTTTCKKCNKTNQIKDAKKLYSTNNSFAAREVLKQLKTNNREPQMVTYKPRMEKQKKWKTEE